MYSRIINPLVCVKFCLISLTRIWTRGPLRLKSYKAPLLDLLNEESCKSGSPNRLEVMPPSSQTSSSLVRNAETFNKTSHHTLAALVFSYPYPSSTILRPEHENTRSLYTITNRFFSRLLSFHHPSRSHHSPPGSFHLYPPRPFSHSTFMRKSKCIVPVRFQNIDSDLYHYPPLHHLIVIPTRTSSECLLPIPYSSPQHTPFCSLFRFKNTNVSFTAVVSGHSIRLMSNFLDYFISSHLCFHLKFYRKGYR